LSNYDIRNRDLFHNTVISFHLDYITEQNWLGKRELNTGEQIRKRTLGRDAGDYPDESRGGKEAGTDSPNGLKYQQHASDRNDTNNHESHPI
jgi:hypothetical protein